MTLPADRLQDGLLRLERSGVRVILTLTGGQWHVKLQMSVDGNSHVKEAIKSYPNQALTSASQALLEELKESQGRINAVVSACDFVTDYVEESP